MSLTQRFQSKVCSPADFVQRLQAREDVIVSDDPCPFPPDRRFLLNLEDLERGRIRIRHYSGPSDAASPILQVDCEPTADGLGLTCTFLESEADFSPRAAREFERLRLKEKEDDREDLVLDVATFDVAAVLFHIVRWPFGWIVRQATALFYFLSHRQGGKAYGKRILALVAETARS